jgi:hypothetical protein
VLLLGVRVSARFWGSSGGRGILSLDRHFRQSPRWKEADLVAVVVVGGDGDGDGDRPWSREEEGKKKRGMGKGGRQWQRKRKGSGRARPLCLSVGTAVPPPATGRWGPWRSGPDGSGRGGKATAARNFFALCAGQPGSCRTGGAGQRRQSVDDRRFVAAAVRTAVMVGELVLLSNRPHA